AVRDAREELKEKLVDMKNKLDNTTNDLKLGALTADRYAELGQHLVVARKPRDAVDPLAELVRLRDKLSHAQPRDTRRRRDLATAHLWLGKAHLQSREFEEAYRCFHHGLDLLEQLQLDTHSAEQRTAITDNLVLFGE